ncbi:MAG: hypothetical protein SH820_03510 [Xanthomonadales bacterium]|nr:hypothetical protein [Xanthomonadales bacterium]
MKTPLLLINFAFFLLLLTQSVMANDATRLSDKNLEGAWELVAYQTSSENLDVSGLQLMKDGHFSIAYHMRSAPGELSARSHAGSYSAAADSINYDVNWWVQDVEGQCSILTEVKESPRAEFDGKDLKLFFASGSVQHWRRLETGH